MNGARLAHAAENFNNYVNFDRAYIDEQSFAHLPESGRVVYADEHKLPIDEWIGTAGPACLYVIQDVVSPDERTVRLMVGNNDAFRVWVNDVQVAESSDPWYWMPYNHDITVKLHHGPNRIVAKLIRRGRTCDFSLGFAVPKTHVRGSTTWYGDSGIVIVLCGVTVTKVRRSPPLILRPHLSRDSDRSPLFLRSS